MKKETKKAAIEAVEQYFEGQQSRTPDSFSQDLALIRQKLHENGVDVRSVDELKRDVPKWKRSTEVLQTCLGLVETSRAKEILVRLLTVPFAKSAVPALLSEYRAASSPALKWAIGNALEVLTVPEIEAQMLEMASDKAAGAARQMVVLGLGKLNSQEAFNVLIGNLADPQTVLHALAGLARMRNPAAIPHVMPLLNDPRAAVRKEARKTLERLGKAALR